MKKITFGILSCALLTGMASCSMFQIDNYDEPKETIRGKVVDVATGDPVLTDQGNLGIRVYMKELSWGPNVDKNPDFYCRPDGTFQNTKIFEGTYQVSVDGPFIPIIRQKSDGTVVYDGSQEVKIKGTKNVTFEVQPFLKVRMVGEPLVADGVITAQVVVERAVSNEDFEAAISSYSDFNSGMLNITDIQLFVSTSPSVGYAARDERWSSAIEYSGSSFNALLGQPVTIKSLGTIPGGYTVFVRAAARINYATESQKRWNYSEKLDIMVPVGPKEPAKPEEKE